MSEVKAVREVDPIEDLARALLREIGEDPDREGLRDTPARYARWWREFTTFDAGDTATTFPSISSGQLVAVSGIEVWSLCEHHLLPFSCSISIGYRTQEQMLGLSKFARIAQGQAHRLQVQERLVNDIADEVEKLTATPDIAVIGRGEHLCMSMRGVRSKATMTSTAWRGAFTEDRELRAELLGFASDHDG